MEQLTQTLPFAGVLLSFAVLPGLFPQFWHRRMAVISLGWILLAVILGTGAGAGAATLQGIAKEVITEFLPFIVLLLALYALGGGILITGGPWGRPAGNLLLLAMGTTLAAIMGTIGAALLLIHPLLAANSKRSEIRHLILAFIILVGNAGGALSPLGDPPLLVGFLRGVPFFWPALHLALPLLLLAAPILALTFGIDMYLAKRETLPPSLPLRIRGAPNILLLLALMLAIPLEGIWHPGLLRLGFFQMPVEHAVVTVFAGVCILLSEKLTSPAIRRRNRFAWMPMREIVILFLAIFATIPPVFILLEQAALNQTQPAAWFWASGIASAILDAAPTYLIFFQAAGGNATHLAAEPAHLLTALAAGSVFFGPATYLGNAPNLMIREIAVRRGVRMPGFFAYAGIMTLVLTPIYVVMNLIFFT